MKRGRGRDFAFALVKSREGSSHPVIAALESFRKLDLTRRPHRASLDAVSSQQWRTPTPPSLWPLPTQRVGPSEKNSLRRIPSSNASRSLILGTGQTTKCALLVYSCSAGKLRGAYCSPWSP